MMAGTLACDATGPTAMAMGEAEAAEDRDLVVHDQFLRQTLGNVGDAGVVLDDDFNRLARNLGAMLGHIGFHAGFELAAGGGLLAGHGKDQADLHGFLSQGGKSRERDGAGGEALQNLFAHFFTP